jgi:hypothetical protein
LWLRTAHSPRVPHFGFNVPGAANLLEDPIDRSIDRDEPSARSDWLSAVLDYLAVVVSVQDPFTCVSCRTTVVPAQVFWTE